MHLRASETSEIMILPEFASLGLRDILNHFLVAVNCKSISQVAFQFCN